MGWPGLGESPVQLLSLSRALLFRGAVHPNAVDVHCDGAREGARREKWVFGQNEDTTELANLDGAEVFQAPVGCRRAGAGRKNGGAIETGGGEPVELCDVDPGGGRVAEIGAVKKRSAPRMKTRGVVDGLRPAERRERADDGAIGPGGERFF